MAQDALLRACEVAGGQSPLATKLGIRQSVIWYWLNRSKKGVAAEFCPAIERETGVPAHELRPDIFVAPAVSDDGKNGAGAASRPVPSGAAPAREAAR